MKLYYFTIDCGDGSSAVGWCTEENLADLYDAFEEDPETYYGNEGEASYITLPDDFDISSLGISKWSFFSKDD